MKHIKSLVKQMKSLMIFLQTYQEGLERKMSRNEFFLIVLIYCIINFKK